MREKNQKEKKRVIKKKTNILRYIENNFVNYQKRIEISNKIQRKSWIFSICSSF